MTDTPIIVALDFPGVPQALTFAQGLDPALCRVKVGNELFTLGGPRLVEQLRQLGLEVFLDLKFHDIPNTVAAAVRSSAELEVWMVNIHASGGTRMMHAAREALETYNPAPLLIGVTVLTSMLEEDLQELGHNVSPQERVLTLADMVRSCGLDGVVCSAQESAALRDSCGSDFTLVTPGIRLRGESAGDQRRVVTPVDAIAAGSDYLVLGRSITRADDPIATLTEIHKELSVAVEK
ncbi:MAG: orotidine-5'-phosphate decarboxylase [Pseudomonadota bacterium]